MAIEVTKAVKEKERVERAKKNRNSECSLGRFATARKLLGYPKMARGKTCSSLRQKRTIDITRVAEAVEVGLATPAIMTRRSHNVILPSR